MLTNDVMHFAMDEKWAFFQFFPNKNTIEMKDDTFVVLFYVYIIAHFFQHTKIAQKSGCWKSNTASTTQFLPLCLV